MFLKTMATGWAVAALLLVGAAVQGGPGDDEPVGPGPGLNCHAPATIVVGSKEGDTFLAWGHAHNMSEVSDADLGLLVYDNPNPMIPLSGFSFSVSYTVVNGGDTIDCEYDVDITGVSPTLKGGNRIFVKPTVLNADDSSWYTAGADSDCVDP